MLENSSPSLDQRIRDVEFRLREDALKEAERDQRVDILSLLQASDPRAQLGERVVNYLVRRHSARRPREPSRDRRSRDAHARRDRRVAGLLDEPDEPMVVDALESLRPLALAENSFERGRRIDFAVVGRSECCDRTLAIRVERAQRDGSQPIPVTIDMETGVGGGAEAVKPRVTIGTQSWTFPAGDPYLTMAATTPANESWNAVAAALVTPLSMTPQRVTDGWWRAHVSLTIDPRVPWSHVAQFLGVADRVQLPYARVPARGLEFSATLEGEFPASENDHPERDPRRLFSPPDTGSLVEIGAGVALALVALFGSGRIGRRHVR